MGFKLENLRARVETAQERHREAAELGHRDVEDIQNVKSILEGIPSDADSDILEAVQDVHDSSISEATADMESDVQSVMDSGSDIAADADSEAREQRALSEKAGSSFENISGSSEFGGSAEGAAEQAREDEEGFGEASEEAQESIEDAEKEFQDMLAEIQS